MTAPLHELILFAVVVVFMSALAVVLVSLHAGAVTGRLRLAFNLFGLGVVIVAAMCGVGLIVWWLMTGRLELLVLAALPLVFAGAIFNLLTRRHMPWYEALGVGGSRARWKGLWNELRETGRSDPGQMARERSGRDVTAGQTTAARRRAPATTRTFSFSFKTGNAESVAGQRPRRTILEFGFGHPEAEAPSPAQGNPRNDARKLTGGGSEATPDAPGARAYDPGAPEAAPDRDP